MSVTTRTLEDFDATALPSRSAFELTWVPPVRLQGHPMGSLPITSSSKKSSVALPTLPSVG